MHPKLLIFDLDGTLIYSIKDLCQACNYALKQLNLEQLPLSHYKKLVGNGIMRLIQKALPEKLRDDILIIEQMKKHFIDYYNQHLFDYSYPYDGIVETLTYFKNNNFFLAIASMARPIMFAAKIGRKNPTFLPPLSSVTMRQNSLNSTGSFARI